MTAKIWEDSAFEPGEKLRIKDPSHPFFGCTGTAKEYWNGPEKVVLVALANMAEAHKELPIWEAHLESMEANNGA